VADLVEDTATGELFDPAELPIQVCMSAAGYYIGQLEPCGCPYSRLSDCYYKTRQEAEKALEQGWPDRDAPENKELTGELESRGKLRRSPLQ
jgi:hypothetical protein